MSAGSQQASCIWSVDDASSKLNALLDASEAGVPQFIERDGVKFLVVREKQIGNNLKEDLLAGGPLDGSDDLGKA